MTVTLNERETDFQAAVIDYAQRTGWLVAHFSDSRREVVDRRTQRRRLVGDRLATGFPDLVLVRSPRIGIVELKGTKGRLPAQQRVWLNALKRVADGSNSVLFVDLWRPTDWDRIQMLLRPATNWDRQLCDRLASEVRW